MEATKPTRIRIIDCLTITMYPFIAAVRKYPCLWKPSHRHYRNAEKKDAAWKTIVDKLKLREIKDVEQAKTQWKKLRDNHRESLKRDKNNQLGEASANPNTWEFAEVMEFLLPYMKTRNRRRSKNVASKMKSSLSSELHGLGYSNDDIKKLAVLLASSADLTDSAYVVPPFELIDLQKRKSCNKCFEILRQMEQNQQKWREELDRQAAKSDMDLFLESMSKTINNMPSSKKIRFKKKIFGEVINTEEELEYSSESTTPDGNDASAKVSKFGFCNLSSDLN